MAEQQQANALAAAFPSPPPFYQHFTTENIARVAELRAAQSSNSTSTSDTQATPNIASGSKTPLRLLDLPPELRFLQPPEPPVEGAYRSFGDIFNVRPTAIDIQGIG
jgi:mediator of RNA polymerase II transcription subunit 7